MVDGDGFKPSSVKFAKGAKASLVFTRTTDETCATEVVFPELNLKKELPKGKPVTVDVPTDKEQTLSFQCGMGMYKSSVVIGAK
jgi:plastocyanin domain-containing protein